MKRGMVIAIDGPSGAGKSTAARLLAKRLGYTYIDTGAMYRAVAWKAMQEGVPLSDEVGLSGLCAEMEISLAADGDLLRINVDGRDVSADIRTPEMGMAASFVSKHQGVRAALLRVQRRLGAMGGVVMDGRDIGTVVFPDANIKFYLDAGVDERARRRHKELVAAGHNVDLPRIAREIVERDRQDMARYIAPLRPAPDAVYIDSSSMSVEEVVEKMLDAIRGKDRV